MIDSAKIKAPEVRHFRSFYCFGFGSRYYLHLYYYELMCVAFVIMYAVSMSLPDLFVQFQY